MSTYLVAIVVGEFDFVSGVTKKGVPMRVFTPLGQSSKGKFALDVGIKVLDYFTDYFGIPYPLPKLDQISIPDFSAGAMENWGLITYREVALLCDENSNVAAKSRVAYVVAHEEAHQWFGNICSPEWWKELWLNEGFATWAGNLACDHIFPEWDAWTQFRSTYQAGALNLDSLLSSHPIEVDIARSRDISSIFDAISYHKGASVILMLADFMGNETFAKGLNLFLTRHSYANAITSDLWKALSEVSGIDVGKMMHNWTSQTGYPVIHVKSVDSGKKLQLTQHRFLSGSVPTEDKDQIIWDVQLAVQTDKHKTQYLHLNQRSHTFDFATHDCHWFRANAGQSGIFRVAYEDDHLKSLVKKAVTQVGPSDRIGIISDAYALCKAGLMNLSDVLALIQQYHHEESYPVWAEICAVVSGVANILDGTSAETSFAEYRRRLFAPIVEKLGWDQKPSDTDLTLLLRPLVLGIYGRVAGEPTAAEVKKRFTAYLNDANSLPSNIRDVVFRLVVWNGDESDVSHLKKIFATAEMPEVKLSALAATGYSNKPNIVSSTLQWALHSGEVRSQDLHTVFNVCTTSSVGKQLTFKFLQDNWDVIVERYGTSGFLGRSLVDSASGGFVTEEKAEEVDAFFKTHTMPAIERTVQQCLERIRTNASLRKRQLESVTHWLSHN